jgi:hypothetical protein
MNSVLAVNVLLENPSYVLHMRPVFQVYPTSENLKPVNVNFLQRCKDCIWNSEAYFQLLL